MLEKLMVPEVGVESCVEVPDFASVNLVTQKKYPQSYPHGSGGTLCVLSPSCLSSWRSELVADSPHDLRRMAASRSPDLEADFIWTIHPVVRR